MGPPHLNASKFSSCHDSQMDRRGSRVKGLRAFRMPPTRVNQPVECLRHRWDLFGHDRGDEAAQAEAARRCSNVACLLRDTGQGYRSRNLNPTSRTRKGTAGYKARM